MKVSYKNGDSHIISVNFEDIAQWIAIVYCMNNSKLSCNYHRSCKTLSQQRHVVPPIPLLHCDQMLFSNLQDGSSGFTPTRLYPWKNSVTKSPDSLPRPAYLPPWRRRRCAIPKANNSPSCNSHFREHANFRLTGYRYAVYCVYPLELPLAACSGSLSFSPEIVGAALV